MCHCGNTGVERTPNKMSAHKVNSGAEMSPSAPAGIRTRNLSITCQVLLPKSHPACVIASERTSIDPVHIYRKAAPVFCHFCAHFVKCKGHPSLCIKFSPFTGLLNLFVIHHFWCVLHSYASLAIFHIQNTLSGTIYYRASLSGLRLVMLSTLFIE